jgi:hypothetical protein
VALEALIKAAQEGLEAGHRAEALAAAAADLAEEDNFIKQNSNNHI